MMQYEEVLQNDDVILEKNGDSYTNYLPRVEDNVYISANSQSKGKDFKFSSFPKKILKSIFLPQGFPESVNEDYLPNRKWAFCQEFWSSVNRTLTTYCVFKAVGVGDVDSSAALTATITFIARDLSGMLGRIGFTWWQGFSLDADCKKWRLIVDIIYDSTLCLELLLSISLFTRYSWQMLCLAAALRSVVDIAGPGSRTAILQHQAIRSNVGDISARDRSQETLMDFVGTISGVLILRNIADYLLRIWILFFLCTVIHIYMNYKAIRSLHFPVLNTSRLILLIKHFLKHDKINSLKAVNEKESIVLGVGDTDKRIFSRKIRLGCSVQKLFGKKSTKFPIDLWKDLRATYSDFPYLISRNNKSINVAFLDHISDKEMIQAYFHSFVLGVVTNNSRTMFKENTELLNLIEKYDGTKLIETLVNNFVTLKWKQFETGLIENGWILSRHQLPIGTSRLLRNEDAKISRI